MKHISNLGSAIQSVTKEREEFLRLVQKEVSEIFCRVWLIIVLSSDTYFYVQIKLYNDVVEKEGTEGEEEALKAYKAAREDSDETTETTLVDKVSSALVDRVCFFFFFWEKDWVCILVVPQFSMQYQVTELNCTVLRANSRLMLCCRSSKKKLTMLMQKLAIAGDCLTSKSSVFKICICEEQSLIMVFNNLLQGLRWKSYRGRSGIGGYVSEGHIRKRGHPRTYHQPFQG